MSKCTYLGILGGLGPASTVYFCELLTNHTLATCDSDHIDMLVSSRATTPDRTAYILDKSSPDPLPVMLAEAHRLENAGVDLIVVPCNTAHYFYDGLARGCKTPILNIIDETTVIFSTESRYRVVTDIYTSQGYSDFYTLDDQSMITSYNGEEMIASSILWVLTENHGVAYMTVGHGETANITLYNILTAAGYEVRDINLRKSEIPEDAELLIISNPTADFESAAEGSSIVAEY